MSIIINKLCKTILALSLGYLTVTASYAVAPGWFPEDAFGGGPARPPVPLQRRTIRHFTPEEDARLRALVDQYGTNWPQIALDMPDRSGRQCRERWCHHPNPDINPSEWTQEEDDLLMEKFAELGRKWALIAQFFPGRTDKSCGSRYYRIQGHQNGIQGAQPPIPVPPPAQQQPPPLQPPQDNVPPQAKHQHQTRWTKEEDARLCALVSQHGTNWLRIALDMPGRSGRQCRVRWVRYLAPNIDPSEWTKAEDDLLLQKFAELGRKWALIARFFSGRTDENCRNRYSVLQRHQRLGHKWDEIAQFFPERTARSCENRWHSGLRGQQNGIQGAQPPIPVPPPAQQQPPPLQPPQDDSSSDDSDIPFESFFKSDDDEYFESFLESDDDGSFES